MGRNSGHIQLQQMTSEGPIFVEGKTKLIFIWYFGLTWNSHFVPRELCGQNSIYMDFQLFPQCNMPIAQCPSMFNNES